jgi:uncharacterized protein YukJ
MPIKYGVLRGRVAKLLHHAPDDRAPHVEVLVQTPDGPWRLAVNVRSDDETDLLYHVESAFRHPILDALAALPQGLTRPQPDDHSLRLDYVRGKLFDTTAMRQVTATAVGDPNELDDRLSEVFDRAIRTDGAEVFALGNPWPPEHKKDQYFHFTPGRGVHDLHMNQGSPPPHDREDGVWQDGGLILRFPDDTAVAFFFAFQSQVWDTDDGTGAPSPTA